MKKSTILWLAAASVLVLLGAAMFTIAMGMSGWDFTRLDTAAYETNTHTITEAFTSMELETDTADIVFVPSQDESCKVVCYEPENARHSVKVEGQTLHIRVVNEQKWYDHIGIHLGQPKVTVYLPQGAYEALRIKSHTGDVRIPRGLSIDSVEISVSTGDIFAEGLTAKSMALRVSTGKITLADIACDGQVSARVSTGDIHAANLLCQAFTSDGSTGGLVLANLIARETIQIDRSTGDVRLEACDAEEIIIHTDTGDVTGTLMTPKVFQVETDTGRVDVPESGSGGKCQIKTDTGDIQVEILE